MRISRGALTALLVAVGPAATADDAVVTWTPAEIRLTAQADHAWTQFPASVEFVHENPQRRLRFEAYWDGEKSWVVRYALPLAGRWTWKSESTDPGLNGQTGQLDVRPPVAAQLSANPNLRGQLAIGPTKRHFTYADGTPCLLLADTLWAGNTARCGLGAASDGPFFQHLRDRREKGFTAVLMKYLNGFDDYDDRPLGDRNEGGYPFLDPNHAELNPAYFQALDKRLQAIWDHGFVACLPVTWWGKTRRPAFTIEQAQAISAYCAVRYGAFNSLWCLGGEYQYTFKDCGWTPADIDRLGQTVQQHNPLNHPLSIHPSGRIDWSPPHNVQSSLPFQNSPWLDHHWLQTGQSIDRMFNIVSRAAENRALAPPRPVFCSESYYDREDDPDQAYHARWQVWTAMLSGCAGHGYGAQGVWQFYDPTDPNGETGQKANRYVPWQQAQAFHGSAMIRPLRTLLESLDWQKIEPHRERLFTDGNPTPNPTARDLRPATCATLGNGTILVYVPRQNANRTLSISGLPRGPYQATWFDPRSAAATSSPAHGSSDAAWTLPERPTPSDEDWVFLLKAAK